MFNPKLIVPCVDLWGLAVKMDLFIEETAKLQKINCFSFAGKQWLASIVMSYCRLSPATCRSMPRSELVTNLLVLLWMNCF